MHYGFITAVEMSRVIVVKSPINIIYHPRSDPPASGKIHHEGTNKHISNDEIHIAIMPKASRTLSQDKQNEKCVD